MYNDIARAGPRYATHAHIHTVTPVMALLSLDVSID